MKILGLILGVLFAAVIAIPFLLYSAFSWGLVLYKFWYWFVIPVFPDLPAISYYAAIGLMFFVDLFKNFHQPSIKDEYLKDSINSRLISILIAPWVVLICAWFVKLFI